MHGYILANLISDCNRQSRKVNLATSLKRHLNFYCWALGSKQMGLTRGNSREITRPVYKRVGIYFEGSQVIRGLLILSQAMNQELFVSFQSTYMTRKQLIFLK